MRGGGEDINGKLNYTVVSYIDMECELIPLNIKQELQANNFFNCLGQ